jgi:alpha-L-rhamnosidase
MKIKSYMYISYRLQKIIFFLAICLFGALPVYSQNNEITGLQCEYQEEPVGMDATTPRFSWQLSATDNVRGQRQTTYHILVASEPTLLDEAQADV